MIFRQQLIKKSLAAFLGLLLGLAVIESVLRIFEKKTYDLGACTSLDKYLHHVMIPNKTCRFKTDEWDVTYKFNSLGLRDDEINLEKPWDEFRILVLGDSFVQGHGITQDKTFVKLLEKNLKEKTGKKFRVINAGVYGYSPLVEYLLLKKEGLLLNPDLVILAFNGTEFFEDRQRFFEIKKSFLNLTDEELDGKIKQGTAEFNFEKINMASKSSANQKVVLPQVSYQLKQWLRTNFKTYATLADFVKKRNQPIQQDVLYQGDIDKDIVAIIRGNKISDDDWQKLWELPIAHIELMNNLLTERSIPLMVIGIPDAFQVSDREWPGREALGIKQNFKDPRGPYQAELSERLTMLGIPFLDLLPDFQNSNQYPLYFTGDGHWREAGHKLAADIIYNALKSTKFDYLLHK